MFLHFGIKDLIDIILMAIFLYSFYRVMRQTRALNLFYGVLLFISAWIIVSKILEMKLLGSILDQLVNVGAIALIILFQDEIRRYFYTIGTHKRMGRILRLFRNTQQSDPDIRHSHEEIFPIVMACQSMSKQKVGALIVMQNDTPLGESIGTGERIDAAISQRLIENIFFKNSPLHDGAMIICNGRIMAASCLLPVSQDMDIPRGFGLRHRAAKGISNETDALAIIVSEETGNISAAYDNTFMTHITEQKLEEILMKGMF